MNTSFRELTAALFASLRPGKAILATSIAALVMGLPTHTRAAEGVFSSGALTSDATSGVSTAKTYTALANVVGGDVLVNGATFAGGGTSGTGWTLTGTPTTFGANGNKTTSFGGQGGGDSIDQLFDGFQYAGNPGVMTLSGLTPGQTYVTTVYCQDWSWPTPATRRVTFLGSEGGSVLFNEDALEASMLRYTFVASGTTMTLTNLPFIPADSLHVYGLSNEQVFNNSWVSGADWTTATWGPAGVPNGVGTNAAFASQGAPTTINLDANRTVGHVQFDGANPWTLSTTNASTLTLQTDSGGVSVLSTPTGSHAISTQVALGSDVVKSGAGTLTMSGAISGPQGVNITGGTLRFGQTNSYTGTTTVGAGTTLDLNDTVQTISLNGGGTVLNDGATAKVLTVNSGNFAGVITDHSTGAGTLALTKASPGTLTLRKSSTYTGATLVSNGVLRLEGSGSPMITDNFSGTGTPDSNNVNFNLAGRQTGSSAPQTWTSVGNNQVGNGGTNVQQPAGTNADYMLLASNSGAGQGVVLGSMPLTAANITGPVKINFDMFRGQPGGDQTNWTSFTLRGATTGNFAFPVVGSGELGFLYRKNAGIQVFNNGGAMATIEATTGGDSFAFYLADGSGTGSPFGGNGTRVIVTQGGNILGSYSLNTGLSGSRFVAFGTGGIVGGVDNLAVTPMQTNILPATSNLSLTATSALQLENVIQTVATLDGVAGSSIAIGPFSSITVNGSANSAFAGTISGAAGGVTKAGNGVLSLSGTNSYGGTTVFAGGVVNVASLANYGADSSLGNRAGDSGAGNVGLLFRGGTLQYTGSTPQSTNRAIRISTNGGATLDASGSVPEATISFTAATSPDFFENGGNRSLTLTGTNTGLNTFNTAIIETGGQTTVFKNGPGTWVLTGANTYSGQTLINAGALRITTNGGLGAGGFSGATNSLVADGAALELQGGITVNEHFHFLGAGPAGRGGLRSVSGDNTLTVDFAIDGNSTIGVDAGSLTITSKIYTDSASLPGITKIGAGTLVYNNASNNIISYTGTTAVNEGTLQVSGSMSGGVDVNATGTLSGGTTGIPGLIGGSVVVHTGGTLSPGVGGIGSLSTGSLSLDGASTFNLEINSGAGTTDLDVVNGSLTLAFNDSVVLSVADLGPLAIANGTLFTFISYSGGYSGGRFTVGGNIIDDYDASTNPNSASFQLSGNSYRIDYDAGGNSVALLAVPEPGVAISLLGGLGMLIGLRRRRSV